MKLHTRSVAALCAVAALAFSQSEKKPRDQGEFDIYSQVVKDAADPANQLAALERWSREYPQTDFTMERQWFYVSAYNGLRQPANVLTAAAPLLDKNFPDPRQQLTVLYLAAVNVQAIAAPGAAQLDTGRRAATALLAFTPTFFTAERKPPATSDGDWAKARADLDRAAGDALDFIALAPASATLAPAPNDAARCAQAEPAFRSALEARPMSARVAYALAGVFRCQQAATPGKVKAALYYFARAAALDPAAGGFADPGMRQSVDAYLRRAYEKFHGSADGLDALRNLAASNAAPPTAFELKSIAEIEDEKNAAYARDFPQLALWAGIRKQLTAPAGGDFFESQLKGAAVPKLKGTLIDARPACRPRDLTVAISEPHRPEVVLRLATPLSGKPDLNVEIQWEGVPSAFSATPFLLTMAAEPAAVENLKMSPCAVPRLKK